MTPDEHRDCAKENEAFVKGIGGAKSKWPGWVITGTFYTALHEVQAFLQENGDDPRNHEARAGILANKYSSLATAYGRLNGLSHAARYQGKHSQQRVNEAFLLLAQIRAEITGQG